MLVGAICGYVGGALVGADGVMGGSVSRAVGVVILFLFIFVSKMFTNGTGSRRAGMSVSGGGGPVQRVLNRVRRRASCLFMCSRGRMSMGRHGAIGMDRRQMTSMLSSLFHGAGMNCTVRKRGVVLVTGAARASTTRRGHRVAKIIGSVGKRAVVKTGVVVGNANANIDAGVSKRFSVRTTTNSRLVISFVKCLARAVGVSSRGALGVGLLRSAGALRRIIMMNCAMRAGSTMAKSMTMIGTSGLGSMGALRMKDVLRKGMSNMCISNSSNRPNRTDGVHVHNGNALGSSISPL